MIMAVILIAALLIQGCSSNTNEIVRSIWFGSLETNATVSYLGGSNVQIENRENALQLVNDDFSKKIRSIFINNDLEVGFQKLIFFCWSSE